MSLRIAFQMDPIDKINIAEDTTFRIAEEAQKRGHKLFYFLPQDLTYVENELLVLGNSLKVERAVGNHFSLGLRQKLNLVNDVDIVWLRQDPPFDMSYITTTHLLDFLV